MLIANFKPKVGQRVRTNGDGANRKTDRFFEGVVSEVRNKFFFVDHNNPEFNSEEYIPETKGYKYTWCIGLNNTVAIIELINDSEEECNEKTMPNFLKNLSNALKKRLDPATKTLLEAGFRDETLALTKDGRRALLEILAQDNEAAFVAAAQEVIDERAAQEKE